MGLKVWLPLNGDLHNQGCSNIEIIDKNSVVNTNGKIGSCYYFSAASYCVSFPWVFNASDSCSATCWFKLDSVTSSTQWIFNCNAGGGNANTHLGVYITTAGILYTVGTVNATYSTTIQANTWYHIALCLDTVNNKKYLYLNGEQLVNASYSGAGYTTTYCTVGARRNSTGYNYGMIGYANDFRLYNHCLSAAEVKEISQGLVLHYKLDNNGKPDFITDKSAKTVTIASGGTNAYTGYWYLDTSVKANNLLPEDARYTVEYNYTVNTLTSTTASVYSQINTARCAPAISMTALRTTTSGRVRESFNMTAAQATYSSTFRIRFRFYGSPGDSITISNVTIYQGGAEDANIISDSSGYEHNGTVIGSPTLSSNSVHYSTSTYLADGTVSRIVTPSLSFESHAVTLNIWFKSINTSPTGTYHMVVDSNANRQWYEMAVYQTGYFRGGLFVNGARKADNGTSTKCLDGSWHMLTLSYDGTNVNRYVDGVMEKATAAAFSTGLSTPTALTIGRDGPNASYAVKESSLSDFRIYATALSADDILQLYHTNAKVDNLQNLHTYEIKETNRNLLAGRVWMVYNTTTTPFINFNSQGEYQFTANSTGASSEYIPINPTNHTYEYDYTISVNAGNQFYIGFERYDANKTSRSNNACIYTYSTKPSSNIVKQHFTGTVNLSTDGVNPCAFIRLRILNGWNGTTSGVTGTATIHSFSLREIGTKQIPKITKQGQIIEEELKEETATKLHKNGIVETNNLLEF